ncbi:unnamed protein product [Cunninghamella blakesleeana]
MNFMCVILFFYFSSPISFYFLHFFFTLPFFSMASLSNENKNIGKKREYHDNDQVNNNVPKAKEFNFIPKLLPHQKLFNVNTDPSSWSASALTQRYQQRLKEKKRNNNNSIVKKNHPSIYHTTTSATTTNTNTIKYPNTFLSNHLQLQQQQHYNNDSSLFNNYIYHRSLSYTIITYIQLLFRVTILSIILYVVFQLIWTIREDFQIKANDYTNALIQEIQSCAQQYKINLCDPETRVPALEKKCEYWLLCMNRMPHSVTRVRVSAETIAEIINSFVEPISYKAMFFFSLLVIGSFVISNITFRLFPKSNEYHHNQQHTIQAS